MPTFKAKLAKKISRTKKITSFQFEPEKKFDFLAGQFIRLILDEVNISKHDLNKPISLSCAPGKEYFEVTKKLSNSLFSAKLNELKIGDEISFAGPWGNCTLSEQDSKIAFLAGGIGITPVISIIEDIIEQDKDYDLNLLYANKDTAVIAFKDVITTFLDSLKNLKVTYTFTHCQPTDLKCESGFIDDDMIRRVIPDFKQRMTYVFGPPAMVEAMKTHCIGLSCDPAKMKYESFTGY